METYNLYGGKASLTFSPDRHTYQLNGKIIPGVTSVLGGALAKPALVGWAAKVTAQYFLDNLKPGTEYSENQIAAMCELAKKAHRAKKSEAADVGHLVHAAVENFVASGTWGEFTDARVNASIEAFRKWLSEHEVEFLKNEQKVCSMRHEVAGTFDAIAFVDGKTTLIDLKTSSGCYSSMGYQLAAYRMCLEEEYPEVGIQSQLIVNIRKDGTLETREYPDYEKDRNVFLAALVIYRREKAIKDAEYEAAKKSS